MYLAFEFLVNFFQSVLVTYYLIKCLGLKHRGIAGYMTGIAVTLIYLEVSNKVVLFESVGIFVYLCVSMLYSVWLLNGSFIEKVFYNALMLGSIVCSSLLGAGIVGLFHGLDFLSVASDGTGYRCIAVVLTQIILCFLLWLIVSFKKNVINSDVMYMALFCVIPVVSVLICCLIVYRQNQSYKMSVLYTFISVAGIMVVNVVNIILLSMEHSLYVQKMQEDVILNAYQQKEKDVEAIAAIQIENNKYRHEIKNVLTLICELADNGETDKASEIIHKFVGDIKKADVPTIYTPNIVLNYLINRKIRQCKDENIDFNCFISGDIQGIEDVDMYILLENLIDNAIEACVQTDNPRIHLSIFFDAGSMLIEVGNSIKEDILKLNVDMNSTKSDKLNHGFGLKNVKDVVSKYHGSISYDIKIEGYLVCNVTIYAQN